MSEGVGYKVGVRIIPYLVYWLMRLWFCTCRVNTHGSKYYRKIADAGITAIVTFWHYSITFTLYNQRKDSGVAMVSASKDGEYIARLVGHFGFDSVRGSSNSRGMSALKKLMKKVREGANAAIVADGSQGPPLKVQAGSILLASRTGKPILPVAWSADRYVAFGSWDKMVLPKPFAKIEYFYGEPIYIPKKLNQEEFEEQRLLLEKRLNELYLKAWQLQGKTEH